MNPKSRTLSTFYIGNYHLGIDSEYVVDALTKYTLCPVPLSTKDILGIIYHHDELVCTIDLAVSLALPQQSDLKVNLLIKNSLGLLGLLVEQSGKTIEVSGDLYRPIPTQLDNTLKSLLSGVYQLEKSLLLLVNHEKL